MKRVAIGIGHLIHAMQAAQFGHEEIMAMRNAMIAANNLKGIDFIADCFTQGSVDVRFKSIPVYNEEQVLTGYRREYF